MSDTFLYIPTLINAFGVVTNSINTAVFLHPKMKDPSFKYLLASSISDLAYLGLQLAAFNYICKNCLIRRSYFELLYFYIVKLFLNVTIYNSLSYVKIHVL